MMFVSSDLHPLRKSLLHTKIHYSSARQHSDIVRTGSSVIFSTTTTSQNPNRALSPEEKPGDKGPLAPPFGPMAPAGPMAGPMPPMPPMPAMGPVGPPPLTGAYAAYGKGVKGGICVLRGLLVAHEWQELRRVPRETLKSSIHSYWDWRDIVLFATSTEETAFPP